ncbi:MAG: hypothetical protein HY537_08170 [Deltaproteobacteria bacterium]|nr:hypothetical protein [Deltaproteobacteria bacterium]
MNRKILYLVATVVTSTALARQPTVFLCLPEVMWICDGQGSCEKDDSPNTLAAWKVDLGNKNITLCKRSGSECNKAQVITILRQVIGLGIYDVAFAYDDWPGLESFTLDGTKSKFLAVRHSGGFLDFTNNPPQPSLSGMKVISRTGSCVVLK